MLSPPIFSCTESGCQTNFRQAKHPISWWREWKGLSAIFHTSLKPSNQAHRIECAVLVRLPSMTGIHGKFDFEIEFVFDSHILLLNQHWRDGNERRGSQEREGGWIKFGVSLYVMNIQFRLIRFKKFTLIHQWRVLRIEATLYNDPHAWHSMILM